MLEFYAVLEIVIEHFGNGFGIAATLRAAHRRTLRRVALPLAATLATIMLAACTTVFGPDTAPPLPRDAEPPRPTFNLSGFPLPYRQGYADGCASATGAERKDAERYKSDGNYRTGWQDGLLLCKKK